jgi:predicted nucleotidyltransferase
MFERGKTIGIWASFAMLVSLGLTLTCDAHAESDRAAKRTNSHIKACVTEISKEANYADATRVVHVVDRLNQKSLVELDIGVTTSVYSVDEDVAVRIYRTACTTGHFANVVKLHVAKTGTSADRKG